jgi:hypothetical protein
MRGSDSSIAGAMRVMKQCTGTPPDVVPYQIRAGTWAPSMISVTTLLVLSTVISIVILPEPLMPASTTKPAAIAAALAAIGVAGDTAMPALRGSNSAGRIDERAAWRLYVASTIRAYAEKEYKAALAGAIDAGVAFDSKLHPAAPGTERVVFAGSVVEIRVTVTQPREGVDHDAFVVDLAKAGVKPALLAKLAALHATETAAPHSFKCSLVA